MLVKGLQATQGTSEVMTSTVLPDGIDNQHDKGSYIAAFDMIKHM